MDDNNKGRDDSVTDNLRVLVNMGKEVSDNIVRMEDKVRKCFIIISILVLFLYASVLIFFIPFDGVLSTNFIGNSKFSFFKSDLIKIVGLFFWAIPITLYILLIAIKIKKLRDDIESEQDVLNQLLAVTFDVRRSISYSSNRKSVLDYIAIDMDLKRLKFAASKSTKKQRNLKESN